MESSKEVKFFIYGGIFLPVERLSELDEKVREIRGKVGYENGEEFKFDTRSKPRHINKKNFDNAKDKILDLCFDKEAHLLRI